MPADTKNQYDILTRRAGWLVVQRSLVRVTGDDRTSFLNGMTSNDLKTLQPGTGCEAFVLNAQGKIVGFIDIFCQEASLILDAPAGQATDLVQHLDRYLIVEDVALEVWEPQSTLLLVGPDSPSLLEKLGWPAPEGRFEHQVFDTEGASCWLRSVNWVTPRAYALTGEPAQMTRLAEALREAGAIHCEASWFDVLRVEARYPLYGRDFSIENLPQELDRNALAISFTKGCYLGQETVARIDALGHVNRHLSVLRVEGSEPVVEGAPVLQGERVVGRLSTVVSSPRFQAVLALGLVRREVSQPGTELRTEQGQKVQVIAVEDS